MDVFADKIGAEATQAIQVKKMTVNFRVWMMAHLNPTNASWGIKALYFLCLTPPGSSIELFSLLHFIGKTVENILECVRWALFRFAHSSKTIVMVTRSQFGLTHNIHCSLFHRYLLSLTSLKWSNYPKTGLQIKLNNVLKSFKWPISSDLFRCPQSEHNLQYAKLWIFCSHVYWVSKD